MAVLLVVFWQGFLLGNLDLFVYGASAWLLFHLFLPLYKESTLTRSFGTDKRLIVLAFIRGFPNVGYHRKSDAEAPPPYKPPSTRRELLIVDPKGRGSREGFPQ
jgi:hypothetical protein